MKRIRWIVGAMAVTGALGLAGCGGDDDDGGGDLEAFCDKILEIDDAPDPFGAATKDDLDAAADALEESEALFAELVDLAPEEIRPDVEETERYFGEFAAEASKASSPNDFLKVAADFQQENEGFVESTQRIGEFTGENCEAPAPQE